ncbi:hypothetical protein KIL84_007016 [Mauremys mutica]|uniref:Uncharacterized protein n=1 Tax=Mauremys mutica TaxID=74926 RepID=A0A9D3X1Z0_9SAUR|nr:hypothetical protein KIL84_007016 [Mauremys mutica]
MCIQESVCACWSGCLRFEGGVRVHACVFVYINATKSLAWACMILCAWVCGQSKCAAYAAGWAAIQENSYVHKEEFVCLSAMVGRVCIHSVCLCVCAHMQQSACPLWVCVILCIGMNAGPPQLDTCTPSCLCDRVLGEAHAAM